MKKEFLITLTLVFFMLSASMSFAQGKNWTKVYLNSGRSLQIPKGWTFEETTLKNGTVRFLSTNNSGKIFLAMYFYKSKQSAGDRMAGMISANNIDVKKSYTETFGALKVMSRKGKMNYNGKEYNVLISTSEGAGGRWNVVGAFWGDQERFGTHKDKFPIFFQSLD